MAHHIYHTPAIVLKTKSLGEYNQMVSLLTKDVGVVYAIAQGIRKEQSKLRYSVQDYAQVNASLVRGRTVWRVTGAQEIENVFYAVRESEAKKRVLAHLAALIQRLVQGEEENEALFAIMCAAQGATKDVEEQYVMSVESISVIRILHALGYIHADSKISPFITDYTFHDKILKDADDMKKELISEINRALIASHL